MITHGHYDHIEALDLLHEKCPDATIYAPQSEKGVIEDRNINFLNRELKNETRSFIKYIEDGSLIHELGLDILMITTPGHTAGSSCYYISRLKILFSGDTLFRDTYGRYDLPTGDEQLIRESIKTKLFILDGDTKVFPGHGWDTTIEYEKQNNEINY